MHQFDENFLIKYLPGTLADVLGQPGAVDTLTRFVKAPVSTAFLFHGASGVGKGAAANALAGDLGVRIDQDVFGGWTRIASGGLTAESVRREFDGLKQVPMYGSGWRVLVANECDRMAVAVETLLLDILENLPRRSVVVFTTNEPHKLSKRFRDRCESVHFADEAGVLRPAIRTLAEKVWAGEGLKGKCPPFDFLGVPPMEDLLASSASFRLALQQLARITRAARVGGKAAMAQVVAQLKRDVLPEKSDFEAACDHCGHKQDVPYSATECRCAKCRKVFTLSA